MMSCIAFLFAGHVHRVALPPHHTRVAHLLVVEQTSMSTICCASHTVLDCALSSLHHQAHQPHSPHIMFARQSLLSTVAAASASRRAAASFSTSAVRGDLARMQLVGRIVGPTEIKTAANGSEYALYTVATNDSRPSNAEGGSRVHADAAGSP